jgi:hypothetical protein
MNIFWKKPARRTMRARRSRRNKKIFAVFLNPADEKPGNWLTHPSKKLITQIRLRRFVFGRMNFELQQRTFQRLHAHGLDQVGYESGGAAAGDVFLHAVAGQGDAT